MKITILIVCKKCGEIKDISEFYEHKKCRFGVDEICKGCIAERSTSQGWNGKRCRKGTKK